MILLPYFVCCLDIMVTLTSEVILCRCLLVAIVLEPLCCHNQMPYRRHTTTSKYADTGLPCRWDVALKATMTAASLYIP